MTVRDTETGNLFTQHNPRGDLCGFGETGALPARRGAVSSTLLQPGEASSALPSELSSFHGGRFVVEVEWQTPAGSGVGTAVPLSSESAAFWFFRPENLEMLVKVLDGCALNDRYWVFAAATTSVEYDLTVKDATTGEEKRWHNPLGVAAPAITDVNALAACP